VAQPQMTPNAPDQVARRRRRPTECPDVTAARAHPYRIEFDDRAAIGAWRRLAGYPTDGPLRVVVNPESWLAPFGWIGIVAIGDVITASVPTAELRAPVESALAGLVLV